MAPLVVIDFFVTKESKKLTLNILYISISIMKKRATQKEKKTRFCVSAAVRVL